jgi:uncharacterized protein YhbP (UPF0306 family)
VAVERSSRRISSRRLRDLLENLLEASTLCAIATASRSRPYVNTAYFAWTPDFRLVWLSDPEAAHSRNLRTQRAVAIAVYDSRQRWGRPDRGVQLFGSAREARGRVAERAIATYEARFRRFSAAEFEAYRLYEFRPRRVKLFHEPELGGGVFVTARLGSDGGLTWERTERTVAGR